MGTGGAGLYGLSLRGAYSEVWNGSNWGVLKLALYPEEYRWEFVPVAGKGFRDTGSGRCVKKIGSEATLWFGPQPVTPAAIRHRGKPFSFGPGET